VKRGSRLLDREKILDAKRYRERRVPTMSVAPEAK
jgi:hypothetical protein